MKHASLFRILAVVSVSLFICASLLKSIGWYNSFFQAAEDVVGGDKALHLMMTFYIALLVTLAASTYRHQPPAIFFNQTFICLFVLFSIDELFQLLSIYRHFSFADLAVNYIGLLLGWGVSRLLLKITTKEHDQSS